MANDSKLFIVLVEDTEIRAREYVVRAPDEIHAKNLVKAGMFIFESESELIESVNTEIVSTSELAEDNEGQER